LVQIRGAPPVGIARAGGRLTGVDRYPRDVLAAGRPRPANPDPVELTRDLVVEDAETGWCGAVVRWEKTAEGHTVTLEDRHGRHRVFPLGPGFLLAGRPVVLVRPAAPAGPGAPRRTASGSVLPAAAARERARTARAGRIYVEGRQDAELVERVWGDDLRHEGVVVEQLDGIDDLAAAVREFGPGPGRRLGVLVDHLVSGSKEARIAAEVASSHVRVAGHPYVDVWQAVRPRAAGIEAWPVVPSGRPWKDGVCAALGWPADPAAAWRRLLAGVHSYLDLEPALLGPVEELIDFVTADDNAP
jgi:hypothetical protein